MAKDTWKSNVSKLEKTTIGLKFKFPWTRIDGNVEFLHYRFTMTLLVFISGMMTVTQFFGDTIRCSGSGDDDLDTMANWYCLIHSTYTVPKSDPGLSAHPGLAPVRLATNGGDVMRHRYYLWVHLFLLVVGILFYLPRFFWKAMEQGHVTMLTKKLREVKLKNYTKNDWKQVRLVAEYVLAHKGYNGVYFGGFLCAEALYVVNVIAQVVSMDAFLGNEFSTFGFQVLGFTQQDPEVRVDAIEAIFPKVTKCNFNKYGPSGNIVNHDFICLLPFNILNEKFFIWIWCWLLILTLLSLVTFASWILFISSSSYRLRLLLPQNVSSRARLLFDQELTSSDLFFLFLLKWNLKPRLYENLLLNIYHQLLSADEQRLSPALVDPCPHHHHHAPPSEIP